MIIKLYKNKAERNRMDKTNFLDDELVVTGEIREPTSIISPSISIFQVSNVNLIEYNYIQIPDFNRYYFVDNIIAQSNGIFRFDCSVDVLMTFKDDLYELDIVCSRNEFNIWNIGGWNITIRICFIYIKLIS